MPLVVDPGISGEGGRYDTAHIRSAFAEAEYSGVSFNLGLLRFHDSQTGPVFRAHLLAAYPELAQQDADVLAFDWMGRQIITMRPGEGVESNLFLADLGVGEVMELCTVDEFTAVIKSPVLGEVLGEELYNAWKTAVGGEGMALPFEACVEYQTPLYLGGEQSIENLVMIDLDVSWTVGSQILQQTRTLNPGEKVHLEY